MSHRMQLDMAIRLTCYTKCLPSLAGTSPLLLRIASEHQHGPQIHVATCIHRSSTKSTIYFVVWYDQPPLHLLHLVLHLPDQLHGILLLTRLPQCSCAYVPSSQHWVFLYFLGSHDGAKMFWFCGRGCLHIQVSIFVTVRLECSFSQAGGYLQKILQCQSQ